MKEKWLHLTVNAHWFKQIADGVKTSDYRECKPYWISRIAGKEFTHVFIQNGYGRGSPFIIAEIDYIGIIDIKDVPREELLFLIRTLKANTISEIKPSKYYKIKLGKLEVVER